MANVSKGRTIIEFSGNAGQVRSAFHTDIHKFVVNGEEHIANTTDPSIPEALSPVVAGVVALHNFPKQAQSRQVGAFQRDKGTGQLKPLFTYTDTHGTFYALGPADFAKIYNVPTGTYDGTGQSVAIAGQSNINIQDVRDFRTMFGLPANDPQIIVNGPDPGLVAGDELESDLDVEWAGAVAPGAQIIFVTSQTTQANVTQVIGGVDLSALYIVDNNIAPILSESYGLCEPFILTAGNAFYNALWQQAAAEGITVIVAAGDAGSAGCDSSNIELEATNGLAVSGTTSTPYNVSVGGTDFNQFTNPTTYWNTTSDPTTALSALGYIPEVPWNDSACATNYPTACTSVDQHGGDLTAGGGGASNCVVSTTSGTTVTCTTNNSSFPNGGYPKPAFQNGITPADGNRDIPDISLFASDGFNGSFYVICASDLNANNASCNLTTSPTSGVINFVGVGGTSAGTPAFAAIMALVNQKTGQRQGNANYEMYLMAAKQNNANCQAGSFTNPATPAPAACAFYDINQAANTNGIQWNNAVACAGGSPNCSSSISGSFGVLTSTVSVDKGNPGFQSGIGYDLATGLGSINVGNFLTLWGTAARAATTVTLGTPNPTTLVSGQSFTVPITITGGGIGSASLTAYASDQKTILGSFGPFIISGTTATATTNLLPPTTAYVQGYYGGDATHAASASTLVAVNVNGANQVSTTTLNFVSFDSSGNAHLSTSPQTAAYGSPYILQIVVTNSGGASCLNGGTPTTPGSPCPKGTVALTDNGAPLNDWPIAGQLNATNIAKLNNQGVAEDQPIQLDPLGPGSHSLVAAFTSTDGNFQSSSSNTLSVKINQASTSVAVGSSATTITSGTSVTLTAYVITTSNGAGPTGNITFTNGSASLGTGTCAPISGATNSNPPIPLISQFSAYCTATLTTAISSVYPSPTTGPRTPGLPVTPIIVALLSLLLFTLGLRWIPQTRRRLYTYAGLLAIALLVGVIAGCGGGSSGGTSGGSTRTITASYPGDTNYTGQTGTISITVQ